MTNTHDTDVIICGAGASGLTLAIDLARRGVQFVLVDKAAGPFMGSRGKGIQPRTQEIFEDLGVVDRVVAAGGTYPLQRNYTDDGPVDTAVMVRDEPTPDEPYKVPLLVPQFLTERQLRGRLVELGHAPRYRHQLFGFDRDETGVRAGVTTPDGAQTLRARYLIGADGGSSFVRKTLGVDFPGRTLGVRAVVADVHAEGVTFDAWHYWRQGTPEQVSLCPLYGTDMFQLQGPVPFGVDIDVSAEGLTALLRERTKRDDLVVRSVSWGSVYEMNARLADTFRVGRVFLVGDAAHTHPPTGGQGLNTSVQDAYNLGWKLAAVLAGAADTLLDTYERERRPVAQAMLGLTEHLLDAARGGDTRRDRKVNQLDLAYDGSPLNLHSKAGALVQPGHRAPDAPLTGAGGSMNRLFRLFQGTHWTLLGFEVGGDAVPAPRAGLHIHTIGPSGDLRDTYGFFHEAYELDRGQWVLVRPDGHLAGVADTADLTELLNHLDGLGVRAP